MSDVLSRALPAPKRWQELESLAFDVYNGRGSQPRKEVR